MILIFKCYFLEKEKNKEKLKDIPNACNYSIYTGYQSVKSHTIRYSGWKASSDYTHSNSRFNLVVRHRRNNLKPKSMTL